MEKENCFRQWKIFWTTIVISLSGLAVYKAFQIAWKSIDVVVYRPCEGCMIRGITIATEYSLAQPLIGHSLMAIIVSAIIITILCQTRNWILYGKTPFNEE